MRTAECVSPKHPDKMCDRISDTLLDLHLEQDPNSRVAIETCGGNGKVFITGEVTSQANVSEDDIKKVVYDISEVNDVIIHLNQQSPEIAQGVDVGGAGDQGIMIGYACSETNNYMPFEYEHARRLNKLIFEQFPYDGKTQVTINGFDVTAVASFQNAKAKDLEELIYQYFKETNFKVTKTHCNPAGDWNIGGFEADAGLTGRKLAVDNYGPRVPLGGGAFSGKDSTKVDRSAAYMARKIAVDAVREKGLKYAMVELSYAIGYSQPIQAGIKGNKDGINVETGLYFDYVDRDRYDLSPQGIINFLDLRKPIFSETAKWGHMGAGFSWE